MDTRKIAVVLASAFAACAPTTSGAGQEAFNLAGSEWGLESGAHVPFIQFSADGKATGNGSCNQFSGTYTQTGNQLSFGPIMSTKKACLELHTETARSFEGEHMKLVLKSETGEVLLSLNRRDWD